MMHRTENHSPETEEEVRYWALVTGNPVNGFRIFGPFGAKENILEFADVCLPHSVDWWVTELEDTSGFVQPDKKI